MVGDVDLFEKLAALEHARWARWQSYVHSRCKRNEDGSLVIPADLVERWERQIGTSYGELSEKEQNSDREQVREYWPYIKQAVLGAFRLGLIVGD